MADTQKTAWWIGGAAVLIAAVCGVVGGLNSALSALLGGALVSVNWLALRWIVGRAFAGKQKRSAAVVLGLLKLAIFAGAVALALQWNQLDAISFAISLVSSFFGISAQNIFSSPQTTSLAGEGK